MGDVEHGELMAWSGETLRELELNFLDERSSRWLYLSLADADGEPARAELLRGLARYEERHAQVWERLLSGLERPLPPESPFWEHRILSALGRLLGVGAVVPLLHKAEVDGIAKYRRQASSWLSPEAQEAFTTILPEEIAHEVEIFSLMRRLGSSRGPLRSMILGANDGLGSILALAVGVAGATDSGQSVLIAGAAGVVAGAASMAASNLVSVRAEQELIESQARLEREAVSVAPETKRAQLAEALEAQGLTHEEAEAVSRRLAQKPGAFLRALLETRHGIGGLDFESPWRLAAYIGLAFAVSGLVPLLPFLFLPAGPGALASAGLTALALFAAGVARALSTLKPFLRSGLEMVLVGLGSAAVTYLAGLLVGSWAR